jgi:WD40 repeat protein
LAGLASALFFDPQNGRRLFVGKRDGLEVLDPDTFAEALPPLEMNSRLKCWAFGRDGGVLAAGCADGTTHLWELNRGTRLFPPFRQNSWIESVRFSPDGASFLAASDDGTAKIWDLTPSEGIFPGGLPREEMARWATSRDGSTLACVWFDLTVSLIDLETFHERTPRQPIPNASRSWLRRADPWVAVDSTGRHWAAVTGQSPMVGLWRAEPDGVQHLELRHPKRVEYLQFSATGDRLLTLAVDKAIRLWDTTEGRLLHETNPPMSEWFGYGPDGDCRRLRILFHAPHEQRLPGKPRFGFMLFDIEAGLPAGEPLWFHNLPQSMVFSPDERQIALSEMWGHVLDAETGQLLHSFKHGGMTTDIDWSPNGRTILTSGGFNSEIKLWDAATGAPLLAPMSMTRSDKVTAKFSADGRFIHASDDAPSLRVWDAATAEAVTPRWSQPGEIGILNLTTNGRLNAVRERQLCAWELKPTTLPTESISQYAEVLAGRRLGTGGALLPISAQEQADLERSLRSRHPELFEVSTESRRQWHRRQLSKPTTLAQVHADAFHLDRLADLGPLDTDLEELRASVVAGQLPPRDPTAPPELIDLSGYYTHSFGVLPNQESADLPPGIHTLAGTRFDIRGLARLEAMKPEEIEVSVPQPVVRGVPVNRVCRALHFLQAGEELLRLAAGDEVARWIIRFADDTTLEFPVIYGEHLRDWWHFKNQPLAAGKAELAWQGSPPIPLGYGAKNVVLYKSTWINPKPEVPVARLDFVLNKPNTRPFVVAITADPVED